ncbi:Ribosomal biogenesis protein LAS1L-like [Oopsacas minuta]|uniref:Ribosomal biogenesis protein LAS1L-like n=1 Tax=Oopsacas minuta TaxID=111878 RepID=A0AAV7JXZ7_9METZ|nr:Ribosomal biogenesis protein LAS1L-like [Oopsacas minuta]
MSKHYRCTAWRTKQDWHKVCHDLFSTDPIDIRNGLASVQCWQARYKIPIGVEVTCDILQAKLATLQPEIIPEMIRHITSMALIRFVNGISDLYQQKCSVPKSIKDTLLSIGIPVWICDQRHAATHHVMPCMTLLEKAIEFCLKWIYSYYWEVVYSIDIHSSSQNYQTRFAELLKMANNSITNNIPINPRFMTNSLLSLASKIGNRDILSVCLLESHISEIKFDTYPNIRTLPKLHSDNYTLYNFWIRLLATLNTNSSGIFIVSLICKIVQRVSSLQLNELSLLYHGVWLRLALKQLTILPRRRKFLHKNRGKNRKVTNPGSLSKFAPCALHTILSNPGIFTHAAVRTLLKRIPTLCKESRAINILSLSRWISSVRKMDYQSITELNNELHNIVKIQENINYKLNSRQKTNVGWKSVDSRKYLQVPIGECLQ